MKTKQIQPRHNATGNGLMRTCSRQLLADFVANYKKSNSYPDDGEVRVFWLDHDTRTKVSNFFETYLKDMMRTERNAKNGYYKFNTTNATLFKEYLDAAKSIDLSNVPTYTTVPGGEYHQANQYWQIPVPFSKAKQQELLDGYATELQINQKKTNTAKAQQQTAEAELATYQAEQQLQQAKATSNRWIIIACAILAAIIILKRTKNK